MDQTGDRQPPDEDEQPYRPTEVTRPYPPGQDRPGQDEPRYTPTQAAPGSQPGQAAPWYQREQAGPSYSPTQPAPGNQPGQGGPRYQQGPSEPRYSPTQGAPGYQQGQGDPRYSPTQGAPGYQPSHAGSADEATTVGPSYTPTHARPGDRRAQAGPSYSQAGPSYAPTEASPGRGGPTQEPPPRGGTTQAGPAYQQTQGPGYSRPQGRPVYDSVQGHEFAPSAGDAGYLPPPGGRGAQDNSELMRYGPGVPATPPPGASQTAERIWRTGRPEEPVKRPRRWRALAGTALTVILLAASGVVLFLRFHHAPFHVTEVKITEQTQNGCGVNVTGEISTNGSAGTISYQWLFQPDSQAPQPLSQSVVAGQKAVFVTVAVQGSGHGSASRKVTLQVLGPDKGADSTSVVLRC